MKTKFNDWLKDNKPHITRPEKYTNTITTISNHFRNFLNKNIDLYEIKNASELLQLKEEYYSHDEFCEKNKTGKHMYSRSLDLYIEFLKQIDGKSEQIIYADEVDEDTEYVEGKTKKVLVNNYERNPIARKKCIEHFGVTCCVCGFDFE